MNRLVTSVATVAVATVATGGLLVGFAGSAFATTPPWEPDGNSVGGLVFFDSSGNAVTGGNVNNPVSAFVQGTATIRTGDTKATLYGYLPKNGVAPGGWSGEALTGATVYPDASAPATASPTLPLAVGNGAGSLTIANLESDFPNTDTSSDGYAGLYQLRLETTQAGLGANTKYDSADIQITGTGASATWSVVDTAAPVTSSTTTSLTTTQTSPQPSGTSVTLNATVGPATPGTVQFKSGSTNLGSPVPVTAGAASTSTTLLPVGTDALSAVFTAADPLFVSGSTGTASFVITGTPTNTALTENPATGPAQTSVTFTASVTKSSDNSALGAGDGSVQFNATDTSVTPNTTTTIGTVALDASGNAALAYSGFVQGVYNVSATFVPAAGSAFGTSTTASPVTYTATAPQYTPDSQTVDVNIPGGTLTITTPYGPGNPFNLGTAALDPGNDKFVASGPFGSSSSPALGVTVTDTRAGDGSWTASASATDFSDGLGDSINAENLSLTGVTPSYITGNALNTGNPVVTTDIGSSALLGAPYAPGDTSGDGFQPGTSGPHQFATAAHGDGSVNIYGLLTLDAPTSTPTGEYTSTVTFTIA